MTPPRGAASLLQKIPSAQSEIVASSGHVLMAEAPDATLDALVEFFGS
jgi:pimeloyl-ACP methyl ester carboxylesterase